MDAATYKPQKMSHGQIMHITRDCSIDSLPNPQKMSHGQVMHIARDCSIDSQNHKKWTGIRFYGVM